jgi:hypothetical protein
LPAQGAHWPGRACQHFRQAGCFEPNPMRFIAPMRREISVQKSCLNLQRRPFQ